MDAKHVDSTQPIRVLLVDDHPAVRQGLALLLSAEGISVCAEAEKRTEALAQVKDQRPDVAIVDLSLDAGEDSLALIADLHALGVPVLVYSMHGDGRRVGRALAAGALGYVTKRSFHNVLVLGIREVAAGRRFVSREAGAALADNLAEDPPVDALGKLSANELKVYELLGQGEGAYEIAAALHVSTRTVESYYERIKVKLDLKGMHELRRHAIEHFRKHAR